MSNSMKSREQKDRYNETAREKYANDPTFRERQLTKRGRTSGAWLSWESMRTRVLCPTDTRYERYKDISIDSRWDNFENFYADMGDRPKGMTLDRRDNNQGYSKANCRWATSKQQIRNRRVTKLTEEKVSEIKRLLGKVSRPELARMYGVLPCTISNIKAGRIWAEEVVNV